MRRSAAYHFGFANCRKTGRNRIVSFSIMTRLRCTIRYGRVKSGRSRVFFGNSSGEVWAVYEILRESSRRCGRVEVFVGSIELLGYFWFYCHVWLWSKVQLWRMYIIFFNCWIVLWISDLIRLNHDFYLKGNCND